MLDMTVWLFQHTAIDLLLRPMGQVDAELEREPLPRPMIPGEPGGGGWGGRDGGCAYSVFEP